MVFSGYLGAVSVVTTVKWFWFVIGMAVFVPAEAVESPAALAQREASVADDAVLEVWKPAFLSLTTYTVAVRFAASSLCKKVRGTSGCV